MIWLRVNVPVAALRSGDSSERRHRSFFIKVDWFSILTFCELKR
jgi:hypothetical protein